MPASSEVKANSKVIEFSGIKWIVTNSNKPAAPGPNFWSDENVWVDGDGKLHLKLTKNQLTGIWSCAEIVSQQSFGLGKYEFFVEGSLDKFDKNIVFGLFQYSGVDMHDEIDIEWSRWSNAYQPNLQYSVWPKTGVKGTKWTSSTEVDLEGTYTTQRINRSALTVQFQSLHGFRTDDQYAFHVARCSRKKIISTQPMPLFLNLWLYNGKSPSNNKEVEVIIHKFSFTPEN